MMMNEQPVTPGSLSYQTGSSKDEEKNLVDSNSSKNNTRDNHHSQNPRTTSLRSNQHQRHDGSAGNTRDSSPTLTAIEPSPPNYRPPPITTSTNSGTSVGDDMANSTNNGTATTPTKTKSTATATAAAPGASTPTSNQTNNHSRTQSKSNPHKRRSIGDWDFVKTIGAGSMGQVKLGKNRLTAELCAVKVVPRARADAKRRAFGSSSKKGESDESKDIRTVREASIGKLIHHPFICDLLEVHPMTNHYYMLFEYVSGGQMLDYIISHGSLKEKQARKFARSIASALDYLHRNSIVHRDLKIENILISKTGDIKLIDFGLSNLYAPNSLLKTFCGSLYFAAPELLNAYPYVGPEVDVWSFGIVLYVLVSGKVPFDDKSMPELHAKIKRGRVEYPNWLSSDCKDLLSRMLVVNSSERASLHEVVYHPWMTKGYDKPVDSFVPPRKPIQLPLDPEVTKEMAGFEFGSQQDVEQSLTAILESPDYKAAVDNWYKLNEPDGDKKTSRHFSFDFYKRLSFGTSGGGGGATTNSSSSMGGGVADANTPHMLNDPTNAYHPLCSIYFLVLEKQERDRVARSKPEVTISRPDPVYTAPGEAVTLPSAAATTTAASNSSNNTRLRSKTQGADYSPSLQPAMFSPGGNQPQQQQQQNQQQQQQTTSRQYGHQHHASEPTNKPNMASSFLRKLSTKRKPVESPLARSSSINESPEVKRLTPTPPTPPLPRQQLASDFKYPVPPPAGTGSGTSTNSHTVQTSPTKVRRDSSGLTRSPTKTRNMPAEGRILSEQVQAQSQPKNQAQDQNQSSRIRRAPSDRPLAPNFHPNSRAKSLGHARSISAATGQAKQSMFASNNGANSTNTTPAKPTINDEEFYDIALDTPSDNSRSSSSNGMMTGVDPQGMPSIEFPKQVFLKGFFSVQSTSTKSLAFIRADIIRVLTALDMEFTEIRGGFLCVHRSSIKGSDEDQPGLISSPPMSPQAGGSGGSAGVGAGSGHWRKLSFGSGKFSSSRRRGTTGESSGNILDVSDISAESMGLAATGPTASGNAFITGGSDMLGAPQRSSSGARTPLRFEIYIVKVPLLTLHGVQFKKLTGNSWQYKNLATRILGELRL